MLLTLALPQEWTVFYPESGDGLQLQSLTSIPAVLNGASAERVRLVEDACVFDRSRTKTGPAVLMYEFESDQDGIMQAGGGADWFWMVMINGQPVLDMLKSGNNANPISARCHVFYLPVKKGKNLVVAQVLRGSNGWKFAYGPVPFTALENGVLTQPGVGQTDCRITLADGRTIAQSQTLQVVKREGKGKQFTLEAALSPALRLTQTSEEIRTKAGDYALQLTYTISSDQPLELKQAEAVLRMDAGFCARALVRTGAQALPAAQIPPLTPGLKSIVLSDQTQRLSISADASVLTLRNEHVLEIAAAIYAAPGKNSASVTFRIQPGIPPYMIQAGEKWVPLPMQRVVEKGSILDFSFFADRQAPAGRLGRIIPGPQGQFVYEKTGERARLTGANLCFEANYITKEESDELAEVFRRQGYSTVRFHHTDIHMIKGNWNAQTSYDVDPDMMDRLDYLFSAMKKAGLYTTIDFYTMRYFFPGEIEGVDKRISGDIKSLLPVSDSAFTAWAKLVLAWMNHTNPYTGIKWKDDPALLFACPLNEDAIASVLSDSSPAMEIFKQRYATWKTENNMTGEDVTPLRKDPRFTRFAIELKRESNRKIAAFLRENGINIPLTGSNWWNTQAQTFTRAEFDVVDNHQYADHPFNGGYNQSGCIKGDPARSVPVFMMPTRIFGKPFTVTEFNYCFPNRFRSEGGALFGACSALQDWDAVYRFAWSHDRKKNLDIHPISHFDIASDLISLYTDRQIALLFARGDVSPASRKYLYAVTMSEASKDGFGGMWTGGLFPASFSQLGLVSQIGSQPLPENGRINGRYDGVCAQNQPAQAALNGNPFVSLEELPQRTSADAEGELISDTGEIRLNPAKGYLKVVTQKTECLVADAGQKLTGRHLSVDGLDTFTSLSASAMDGQPLVTSARILLFHLTNVLNTRMAFSDGQMRRIEETGTLPHLAYCGKAEVTLRNDNAGLRVYAINNAGQRLRTVDAIYQNGLYCFRVEIAANAAEAVMAYEIAP